MTPLFLQYDSFSKRNISSIVAKQLREYIQICFFFKQKANVYFLMPWFVLCPQYSSVYLEPNNGFLVEVYCSISKFIEAGSCLLSANKHCRARQMTWCCFPYVACTFLLLVYMTWIERPLTILFYFLITNPTLILPS